MTTDRFQLPKMRDQMLKVLHILKYPFMQIRAKRIAVDDSLVTS